MSALQDKVQTEIAEDKAFLRQMRPELIKKRLRGDAPTAPSGPQLGKRPKPARSGGGPSPLVVVGIAFVAGVALAKWLDWRGHAHPSW